MAKQAVTTVRLDERLRKKVMREAKKAGLNFSDVVQMLLAAFAEGSVHIGVTRYPPGYIEKLEKEADEADRLLRSGKAKTYASAKEMLADILKE